MALLTVKNIADDESADQADRNKACERAKTQIPSRSDQQKELDQLKVGEYTRYCGGQSIPLQEFQHMMRRGKKAKKKLQPERQKQEEINQSGCEPLNLENTYERVFWGT